MTATDVLSLCAFAMACLAFYIAETPRLRNRPLRSAILWMAGGAAIATGMICLFVLR